MHSRNLHPMSFIRHAFLGIRMQSTFSKNVCKLIKFFSSFPVNADCPKLAPMQWTNPRDSRCITGSSSVNKICGFSCPVGYALKNDHNRVYFQLVCQPNGTWSGDIHKCVGELFV